MENFNLNDLTGNIINTGTGISNQDEIADLTANDPNVLRQQRVDLTANDPNVKKMRTIADLSQLPETDEEGTPMYQSVAHAIADGDDFKSYLDTLANERKEMEEAINEHNTKVAELLGEEVPENITDEDIMRSAGDLQDLGIKDEADFEEALDPELALLREEDEVDEEEEELLREDSNAYRFTPQKKTGLETIEEKENTNITNNIKKGNIGVDVSYDIDDEDLDDLYDDIENTNNDDDENLKELQKEIGDRIIPVANKLDLSSFTIVNKPVSVDSIIKSEEEIVVDWALMGSKTHFAMKRFTGAEITALSENRGANAYSRLHNRYKVLLDHMVGPNKPTSVKELAQTVSYSDNDALFAAVYVGAFSDANYIPYDCDGNNCHNTFMSDNIPIEECYSFSDEKAEKEFNRIRNRELYDIAPLYVSAITQISDKFAISFRDPSIYSILFEPALLDNKFREKYGDIITVLAYIDKIYAIDANNASIYPIEAKVFRNNEAKTVKSRIVQYARILRSLTADQYNIITAYINKIDENNKAIKWHIPECTCPKCGKVIKARDVDATTLLFTRHQLAAIATITLN